MYVRGVCLCLYLYELYVRVYISSDNERAAHIGAHFLIKL